MANNTKPGSDMVVLPKVAREYRDPHDYPKGIAYLDGQYVDMAYAKVSLLDWGFLHSDATYDTVHVWDGRFFRLNLHLERFFQGMEKLRMDIGMTESEVAEVLHNCAALSGHRAAYVEMICTRGTSPVFSRDPREAVNRFMAFAVPYGSVANAAQMERGLHIAVSDTIRIPPESVDPTIKNYHWLDLVRGLYDAYDKQAETGLVCDSAGNIAEGPGFNVFIVTDGMLSTPDRAVLPGITRRSVFDLCAEMQIPVRACAVSREALSNADEVFITSTAGGIMPVTKIDALPVGEGAVGPLTKRLAARYWAKHSHPAWSTPVFYPDNDRDAVVEDH